ncbi:molybdopterin-dependent oxidoreductase [Rhodovulum sp. DZ06]|uniref:molybdopterin-dependent oxidoreductase n=1 Tax=Rhodovulum sp. DZ06 TaxID=3425126 RepID=UPI003D354AC0
MHARWRSPPPARSTPRRAATALRAALRAALCAALVAAALCVAAPPAQAQAQQAQQAPAPLPQPEGKVLLVVSGAIGVANVGGKAMFDRAMLEALGTESFTTRTNWTDGAVRFSGPPLQALMERLGVAGGVLMATAINDYMIEMPVADARAPGPILALEMDGAPMSVRDKGPIWIVYPYDADPAWRTEEIYARSVWQLDRLEIVD